MYMFFWFFKQLYYILKRFTKHKFLLLLVFFVIAFFLFFCPSRVHAVSIPYNCSQVEYIEATGTQYINTGIVPTTNTSIDITFSDSYFTSNSTKTIIGSGGPANTGYCGLSRYNSTFQLYWGYSRNVSYTAYTNTIYNIKINSNNSKTIIINNTSFNYQDNVSFFDNNNSMTIFCFHYNNGLVQYCNSTKLYSCKIYDENTHDLLRDFIPVLNNTTNEACLYDTVTDTLYTNNGTGSFNYGNIVSPYITNSSNSIVDFSFNNLDINANFLDPNDSYELRFTYPNVNTSYTGVIDQYKVITNNLLTFSIPKYWFTSDIVVRDGARISFDLIRYHRSGNAVSSQNYSMGSYILSLTTEQENAINEDSNKQLLSDINKTQQETNNKLDNLNSSQQNTTNAINNLNNTITDSNIDDNSINLPTDNTNDITQDGLNSIFTSIYNAFCVGQPQDIVFPIPFTNKNITLQANYVRNMLTNNGANWVITIIEAFWWYLISRFIIKDITNKITKIKSGNIEDIENTNIKGDML